MISLGRHSAKVLSKTVDTCNSIVAMVRDLRRHLTYNSREHGIQCMPCFSKIISEMLLDIHTMEKCDFLKPIVHSQMI